jgi:lipid-binding SYLF domain-containing protein
MIMNRSLDSFRSRFFGSGFLSRKMQARLASEMLVLLAVLLLTPNPGVAFSWPGDDPTPDEQRRELQQVRSAALTELFKANPGLEPVVDHASGYAVFSNLGLKIGVIASQHGAGVLRDNRTGRDTYMKMLSAGGGWGLGIKDFRIVFIFLTDEALDRFSASGWDFSGEASAQVQGEVDGSGIGLVESAMPGVEIYQLTETGATLQATLQGTKFWVDEDLN